jgi:predicted O-methyltransferase YrrM
MKAIPRGPGLVVAGLVTLVAALSAAVPSPGEEPAAPAAVRAPGERDAALEAFLADLEATGGKKLNAPREDARFLNLLVKAAGAKRALEVGTSNGYSAIWIALALETTDGRLTTLEIDSDRVKEAKANLARAGVAGRVTCLEGDAHAVVRTLEGPFDFIFLDADKGGEKDYFDALFPKLAPGGVIVVHNAIRMKSMMREYLDVVTKHPELDTVTVSLTMDDGFCVSRRKRK